MDLHTALLLALIGAVCGADSFVEVFQIYRPVVVGFLVGLVLGDVKMGLQVGAIFELVFMGQTAAFGGAQPPNMVIGTLIGVTFAIVGKMAPQASIAIGVPFAILMQAIMTAFCTALAFLMHKNDKYIEQLDLSGFARSQITGLLMCAVLYFVVAFIPIYFGADKAAVAIKALPQWIINGLSIAGGVLPAIGFAMLLKMMFKGEYIAFLLAGFVVTSYMNLPILALAILSLCFVAYDFFANRNRGAAVAAVEEQDGI